MPESKHIDSNSAGHRFSSETSNSGKIGIAWITNSHRQGLTLIELIVVLAILIGLASLLVPVLTSSREDSAEQTTQASLVALRAAVIQQYQDTRFINYDGTNTVAVEANRFHLRWLFENPVTGDRTIGFDPVARTGWNGPYLASNTGIYDENQGNLGTDYGTDDDPTVVDSFTGTAIVCQVVPGSNPLDVRLVSAGFNGNIDIDQNDATVDLDQEGGTESTGDDIYVAFTLR